MNVHFHTLVPDGVFVLDGDAPHRFAAIPPPRDEDVAAILERVARRTGKVLLGFDDEVERRLRFSDEVPHSRHGAFLDGPDSRTSSECPSTGRAAARAW